MNSALIYLIMISIILSNKNYIYIFIDSTYVNTKGIMCANQSTSLKINGLNKNTVVCIKETFARD